MEGGRKKKTRKKKGLMCAKACCGAPVMKCGCPKSCPHCNCHEIQRLRRLLKKSIQIKKNTKKKKRRTKRRTKGRR